MGRDSGMRGGSHAHRREQDSRDKRIEKLDRENAKLINNLARTSRDRWKRRSEHLKKQLDDARRAVRRQAAPFARGADTQQVLSSAVRTVANAALDLPPLISEMLRTREPAVPEAFGLPATARVGS